MAEASISVGQDQFMCPVCLDLLKDPVTIPCGHSYCMGCIKGCWDQDDQRGVYSCPQCRQTFSPRPVLYKNTMLAEVVEKLKKMRLQDAAPPAHCYAGPGDVECGVCTGTKLKAIKSCLVCLDSYCQTHFEQHEKLFKGKRHNVIDATGKLQDQICPHHNELIKLWCRTDQQFMCYLCMVDEHRDHKTVSVAAERTERQKQLGESKRKTQKRIQEREKEVQELRQAVESLRRSAQAAVEDSERIFTELIRSIERRCREVTELIRDQEKSELSRAEGVLERLEQDISDLRRRDTELEQLTHTEDHIHFLKSFSSLCAPTGSEDLPSITVSPHLSFEDVGKSVSQLKERLEDFWKEDLMNPFVSLVTNIETIPLPEPKTREQFLQYSCDLTLDPNTVNKYLCLSEGNRVATCSNTVQLYLDHPERFDEWYQVLCRESVSARCYWETEWSGDSGVYISVSYKDIRRKGRGYECGFGRNDQSWSLFCSPSNYSFIHNNKVTKLPIVPSSSRIGVYVDHRAGTLSFYSVSDTMTLLHRVQTTFTQPLYPGFNVCFVSTVNISECVISKMAEASISVDQDQFMCPVCLDLLKDPVAIPCGHSYCMGCIKGYWDQDDQKGVYSCPQCRQTFVPRPVLGKNAILAEMVEKVKKTRPQPTAPPAHCYAGPGDVECGVCTGTKLKAIKSCLVCLDSYCQTHFEQHEKLFNGKRHNVIDATGKLQDQICPHHNKLIELWCQTDQQFMCYLCLVDEHRDHKTVSVAAERTERQKQLGESQRKTQQRIQEREKEVKELRQAVESLRRSAQAAVEGSVRIFTELIRSIERRCREVIELIRGQAKTELSQAEGVLERLEQEIVDLRRRDTELEQLSHTEDHIHFLQSFSSLCSPPGSEVLPSITVSPHLSFEDVGKSVSQLKDRLEDFCEEEFGRLSTHTAADIKIIPPPEPRSREFLQYSCDLTLDPNTAYKHLCLSEGNRVVTYSNTVQSYPDHPERFDGCYQVLCRESVSARCYWETEWGGYNWVSISVSYKDIRRKGQGSECGFGYNNQSWSLDCSPSEYSFWHNNKKTQLSIVPSSSRIGVYVDHRAGTLSFYSVSDTMILLHRVHTTFTQSLCPGFWVGWQSALRLCCFRK
ncbi:E3 ubiquitin/ISG15 ligase TRIM25-like [Chanos chanos]|uniref:E3 ubiquitin/ISG15 ligase TRIM25-like n=1 Tax=Chanos chanos TaxID=29144 RepID=A0A6J2VMV0_CHACN|nr:E3 ubiquitin/ISG15 ligase TRIM25-like [Chanos chanos]